MPVIVRPARKVALSEHARQNPRSPLPADLLDAQIHNLIEAIKSTQAALDDIRRDDGKLKNRSVGPEQLTSDITRLILDGIEARASAMTARAEAAAASARHTEDNVALIARDAEAAAIASSQFLSRVAAADDSVARRTDQVVNLSDEVETHATESENWASYSKAQADNAIAARDEALQWAEYLAGPVVDSAKAPAYIENSPFPHGLYYQPVQGYGGNAGLWSAKWWAIYAAQLVGPWGFYYLGGWPTPPVPGSTNPSTGVSVPHPLAEGSFYYDTSTDQIYVWNGAEWRTPYSLSPGYQNNYVYVATAGQTVFSGADSRGQIPIVGISPSDVHLNGVRLVKDSDYSIDSAASKLTLATPAAVNSIVQWDLLVPDTMLAPGAVSIFSTQITPAPDGTTSSFTMTYSNPATGVQPVEATSSAQVIVSLDGVIQQPGVDFNASGSSLLTLAAPPPADSRLWAVWIANSILTPTPVTYAAWNPADKSAGVTLTNNDLTATASGGNQGARATKGVSAGKRYFEVSFTSMQGYVGLGLISAPFNATTGAAAIAPSSGWIQVNGSSVLNIGGLLSPIGIAVDLDTKRIWFRAAPSGNWNGNATYNPATNTGGVDISALSGALYPVVTTLLGTNNPTANFGASSFTGTVPSGFTAGWPA